MKVLASFALLAVMAAGAGCATHRVDSGQPRLAPFRTDGCSLFLEGTYANKDLWRDCCIEHDRAYWKGGTKAERRYADLKLKECIVEKTGDAALAQLAFDAVEVWGSPIFPTWYRWGYGWPYQRQYGPLTVQEREQVALRLHQEHISERQVR